MKWNKWIAALILMVLSGRSQTDFKALIKRLQKGDSTEFKTVVGNKIEGFFCDDSLQYAYYFLCRAELEKLRGTRRDLRFLSNAVELLKTRNDNAALFLVHSRLGYFYYNNNELEKSLSYFTKAIGFYDGDKNAVAYISKLMIVGIIEGRVGNYRKGINIFQNILKSLDKNDDLNSRSHAFYNMAIPYYDMGKMDSAVFFLNKSIEIQKKLGDSLSIANNLVFLGSIEMKRKNPAMALAYYNQAENTFKSDQQLMKYHLTNLTNMGEAHILLGQYDKAYGFLQRAFEGSMHSNDKEIQLLVASHLKKLFLAKGDYKNAFKFQESELALSDSLFNIEKKQDLLMQTTNMEFNQKMVEDSLRFESQRQKLENRLIRSEEKEHLKNIIIGVALLVLLLGILFYVYALKQRKQKQEIEFEKKIADARIAFLISQINPHFIFNSLNSVMTVIERSDKTEASKYLSKFSIMIQQVLEGLGKRSVLLKDEINLLKLYMEMEQFRNNNKFNFSIELDDAIDADNTQIPFMMLQPFVENAIVHGIHNKIKDSEANGVSYSGEVIISCRKDGQKLIFSIKDNGIGRYMAGKLNQIPGAGQKAEDIQVAEERLSLLSNNNCKIIYRDIRDQFSGEAKGTEAIVELPILN